MNKKISVHELLTALLAIIIVMTLVYPLLLSARQKERNKICASNERLLSLGFIAYAEDNDNNLPSMACGQLGVRKTGWVYYTTFGTPAVKARFDVARGLLYPYVRHNLIYICPSDPAGPDAGNSYSANGCLAPDACALGLGMGDSLSKVALPATTMLLSQEVAAAGPGNGTDDGYLKLGPNSFSDIDGGGCNVAFVDGHVHYYSQPNAIALALVTGEGSLPCP